MAAGIQEAVKQQIVTVIKSVANTGPVFDRTKYSSNWQRFLDQFAFVDPVTGHKQVRGWWITLPTLSEDITGRDFQFHWHNYTYPIHGVMTYSDQGQTEPDFNNLVWSVYGALHIQGVLGLGPANAIAGASVIDGSVDVTVPTVDLRFFGSTLCHHVEMQMVVGVNEPVAFVP